VTTTLPARLRVALSDLYTDVCFSSFDSASLAILDKLNTIEELLRGTSNDPNTNPTAAGVAAAAPSDNSIAEGDSRATLSRLKSLNSPSLERAKDSAPFHMNIEGVLSWTVFDNLNASLDLKGLLNATSNYASGPGPGSNLSMATADFDEHYAEEGLVARFMNNVFIYNPVLEEAKIHRYVRDARFNGIGWDAQSCLLVNTNLKFGQKKKG
jgi:hypothetical protein